MSDGKINIVVVSCGRPFTLAACLRSIERNTEIPYYVTIVNNTFPHWKEAMQRHYDTWLNKYPDWKLVEGTDNYILEAKNRGINARPDAKYHVDIDDDIFVTKEWLSRMAKGLDEHPEWGIVVPLLNFVPGYSWPKQVAWIPEKLTNSLYFNKFYGENFLKGLWEYHEKNLLPEENVFEEHRTFEFSCVVKRPGWLWDDKLDRGRCGFAGTGDLTLRLEEKGLKVAICRSVVVIHAISGSLASDPRFRHELPVDYWQKKWGEKTKGLPGPTATPMPTQKEFSRRNMLKGAPASEKELHELEEMKLWKSKGYSLPVSPDS